MKNHIKIIILVLLLTVCTFFTAAQNTKSTEEIEKEAKETFSMAKKLIYDKEWKKAAAAFENIVENFKNSSFVDDSFYWRAFSLNKMSQDIANEGGTSSLFPVADLQIISSELVGAW